MRSFEVWDINFAEKVYLVEEAKIVYIYKRGISAIVIYSKKSEPHLL